MARVGPFTGGPYAAASTRPLNPPLSVPGDKKFQNDLRKFVALLLENRPDFLFFGLFP